MDQKGFALIFLVIALFTSFTIAQETENYCEWTDSDRITMTITDCRLIYVDATERQIIEHAVGLIGMLKYDQLKRYKNQVSLGTLTETPETEETKIEVENIINKLEELMKGDDFYTIKKNIKGDDIYTIKKNTVKLIKVSGKFSKLLTFGGLFECGGPWNIYGTSDLNINAVEDCPQDYGKAVRAKLGVWKLRELKDMLNDGQISKDDHDVSATKVFMRFLN